MKGLSEGCQLITYVADLTVERSKLLGEVLNLRRLSIAVSTQVRDTIRGDS